MGISTLAYDYLYVYFIQRLIISRYIMEPTERVCMGAHETVFNYKILLICRSFSSHNTIVFVIILLLVVNEYGR